MERRSAGRRAAAALVAVLALAACGGDHGPIADSRAPFAATDGEIQLDRAAIAARREAWVSARPAAYTYEVETMCDCILAGTYTVTVDGEEVLGVESHEPDAERYRMYSPPVLDRAFAMLDEPLALVESDEISRGHASAAFDPTFGFPASWTVAGSGEIPSFHVDVRDFEPLDPAVVDRSPHGLALVVSNQSFDDPDVGLVVMVDGEVVVDRSFAVESQHSYISYRIPLEPGEHQLSVRADTGATHQRTVMLGSERRYVALLYWGGAAAAPETFSLTESDRPLAFG